MVGPAGSSGKALRISHHPYGVTYREPIPDQQAEPLAWVALEALGPSHWGQQTPKGLPACGPHSLCTRITASRERMALGLGFRFQPSSERGSTCRKQYISHPSQGPTGPALSYPKVPGFPGTNRHVILALPRAETRALNLT